MTFVCQTCGKKCKTKQGLVNHKKHNHVFIDQRPLLPGVRKITSFFSRKKVSEDLDLGDIPMKTLPKSSNKSIESEAPTRAKVQRLHDLDEALRNIGSERSQEKPKEKPMPAKRKKFVVRKKISENMYVIPEEKIGKNPDRLSVQYSSSILREVTFCVVYNLQNPTTALSNPKYHRLLGGGVYCKEKFT